jgi:phosphoesterase RecJ-like protein
MSRKENSVEQALHRAASALRACGSAVVLTHVFPDGDAIGAGLGLALALERLGVRVVFAVPGGPPAQYRFLPGQQLLVTDRQCFQADLAVYVDCTGPDRVEGMRVASRQVVNIDHHITNTGFGDVVFVDTDAPATGEQVYRLLEPLGVPLDLDIATCLYTALFSDTGQFSYENATPPAFRVAAQLVEAGVLPDRMARQLLGNRPLSALQLLGRALLGLELRELGRLAVLELRHQDMVECRAMAEDTDGIVNYGLSLAGVELSVLLKEQADGTVRVSLRSAGRVDVSALASGLGGGGHSRAAGCTVKAPLPRARELLVALAGAQLRWP